MPYPAHHSINPSHSLLIASSLAFASSTSTPNSSSSSEDRCGRTPTTSSSPSTPTATKRTRNRTRRGTRFPRPRFRFRRTTQPAHLRLIAHQFRLRLPHRRARGLDRLSQRRAAPALAWSCGLFGSKQEGEEVVPLAPVSRPAVGDNGGRGPICLGVG
ncbi:hypothetical protein B0H16DRAFT_1585899 [Mycena metata]|uniref:Uncharacterized protein n=1 Tax=Mycena metata TaxID=1033252 RepID=A0AAD7MRU5_9AGAR|nr:hypothetical protein B0H16DRAFT_1585899 [Mycena metata]